MMGKISVHCFSVALGLAALACESGGVGDPCVPEDEYQLEFAGYGVDEVNIESKSFQCETRVCIVNGFQGRVSCPYGQIEPEGGFPANSTDGQFCRIPGTDEVIQQPVSPQLTDRRPDKAVYCSCRCANAEGNTDDGARYCECPSGYSCTRLVDDLGLGDKQLTGSYCVKDNSMPGPGVESGTTCVLGSGEGVFGHCGNEGFNP